jgi:hypothetical protein
VKRRKLEDEHGRAAQRRRDLIRGHIKRSRVLLEPLVGGFLQRELGAPRRDWIDVPAQAWGAGLVNKGTVDFVPSFSRRRFSNMSCLYVNGGDEKTGLGVAYASEPS